MGRGRVVSHDLLHTRREARSVSGMTTTDDYRVAQLVAGIIEDTELTAPADAPETWNVKEATKLYVQATLDNGYLSSSDDTPVWDLVAELGHDRNDMDSLAVYHQIAALIDENDFFND